MHYMNENHITGIIGKQIKKGYFKNANKIFIYGLGEDTENLYRLLKRHDIQPHAYLINEDLYTDFKGIKVLNVNSQNFSKLDYICVFKQDYIYVKKYRKICNIFILPENKNNYKLQKLNTIMQGKKVFKNIKKYYNGIPVFVFAGKSGDLYNACVYFKQYIECNKINDYIVTVVGQACVQVMKMFGINNVFQVSLSETISLVKLALLCGEKELNLFIIHRTNAHIPHSIIKNMMCDNTLNLGTIYKYLAFSLSDEDYPIQPVYDNVNVEDIAKRYGIKLKESVILSPYANSYMDFSMVLFWENLAFKLKSMGFEVFTNSIGDTEPIIKGTKGINFPLADANYILEAAGIFVGLRSGLCDIISNAKCTKIVLYSGNILWERGEFYKFHSLSLMGLSNDVNEIVFDDLEKLLSEVIDIVYKNRFKNEYV